MIIAHRMRTVAGADKIVVLSDGTVAEQGNSDMLLKKNGIYARMVKLQTQKARIGRWSNKDGVWFAFRDGNNRVKIKA